MPTASDFQKALTKIFQDTQAQGLSYIDVRAGDLHSYVGGYPCSNHRMPVCCDVMHRIMQTDDKILCAPPSGCGANLKIRYKLPRRNENGDQRLNVEIVKERDKASREEKSSMRFENLARKILSKHFGIPLTKGKVSNVPKEFDMVSSDGHVVGDAKYLTMVRGERMPPAKFSMIAEHVWLLEKIPAINKFLVFGNDRRVPQEWLKKYGHLVKNVVFFFLDEHTQRLEKLN
jgi:hypothetical protein